MLDLDAFPSQLWKTTTSGDLSSKNISNIMRQNVKILADAQDRQSDYTMKRNRVGSTFESLLRSVGLAAGVIVGGPVGAATLGSIGGGIGRGLGEHMGNKIYGQTMHELDTVIEDYKYRQLSNNYYLGMNKGIADINGELYSQVLESYKQTAEDLGQQV